MKRDVKIEMKDIKWPEKAGFIIAAPGFKYIGIAGVIAALAMGLGGAVSGGIGLGLFAFVCWFFRDPERTIPPQSNALVSPADGKVISIETIENSTVVSGSCIRVCIFMNVFNVHVNRVPMGGKVEKVTYFPGKFFNASLDKASEHNERNALVIKTPQGAVYGVVQIAGLIARRIVCHIKPGDRLERGKRYGMIRFGSRLDLHLPLNTNIAVTLGQKVSAGSSIVGYLGREHEK
ncbi:phosphatidylserine decarboxylase [Desulfocicer vacuolatum DSM 3385]|uniref:Phosphatidylserine decarboxylase proenzyme n=1 Tax=Desulfocicer vacuolatum DSM 3385 TaxID=1121400 RepID=A0A1W1ZCR6_9BACT|nr:phosphatidylserine decarboxylase family protein [Desulfocicer vacuolatum]SMC46219.1 phosphatidylserine decarboxylase [Desulfocicer vacuolatum DSM 3385]